MEVMVYIHGLNDDPIDVDSGDLGRDIGTVRAHAIRKAVEVSKALEQPKSARE
jgi:hypothetical protein